MRSLCVFAKRPVAGTVKTRLAATMGAPAAARLYEAMLRWTLRRVAPGAWTTHLCFAPDDVPARDYFGGLADEFRLAGAFAQREGDLGARMRRCIEQRLAAGACHVVLIGSDCPDLDASHVAAAFAALDDAADLVLGPSLDGGYYLIGTASAPATLFEGIAWSTPDVLPATRARADAAGLRVHELEPLADIDEPADLARLPPALRPVIV